MAKPVAAMPRWCPRCAKQRDRDLRMAWQPCGFAASRKLATRSYRGGPQRLCSGQLLVSRFVHLRAPRALSGCSAVVCAEMGTWVAPVLASCDDVALGRASPRIFGRSQ